MDAHAPEQLPLFPKDRASDLARAHLDMAWEVIQRRTYLSDAAIAEQYACLAHQRELLVMRTYSEQRLRMELARPRFAPQARPTAPPTVARLAG